KAADNHGSVMPGLSRAAAVYTGATSMRTSRRGFLKAASAAPAFGIGQQTPPRPRATVVHDSSFDPWVEVDAAKLRHNAAEIHRRAGRPILAVIKNNGYGTGVANVARALEPLPSIS